MQHRRGTAARQAKGRRKPRQRKTKHKFGKGGWREGQGTDEAKQRKATAQTRPRLKTPKSGGSNRGLRNDTRGNTEHVCEASLRQAVDTLISHSKTTPAPPARICRYGTTIAEGLQEGSGSGARNGYWIRGDNLAWCRVGAKTTLLQTYFKVTGCGGKEKNTVGRATYLERVRKPRNDPASLVGRPARGELRPCPRSPARAIAPSPVSRPAACWCLTN